MTQTVMRISVKRLTITLFVFLTPLSIMMPRPAQAQWGGQWTNPYTGNKFNNPISSSLDTMIMHSMQRRMMYRGMLRKKGYSETRIDQIMHKSEDEIKAIVLGGKGNATASSAKSAPTKPATTNAVPATRFKPTGNRLLMNSFVNTLGKTQEQKDSLRQVFQEVFKAYEAEAAKSSVANDIAGAMTFYIAAHYSAYNDGTDVSETGTEAMVQQLRTMFDSEGMRKASNADKQKLYETFVMLGGFTLAVSQAAADSKDADMPKLRKQMGADGLKSLLKVEPSRVKISDKGLEIGPERTGE
jgi:hypothetical protein